MDSAPPRLLPLQLELSSHLLQAGLQCTGFRNTGDDFNLFYAIYKGHDRIGEKRENKWNVTLYELFCIGNPIPFYYLFFLK